MPHSRQQAGFSLIEALVALVVLAISAVSLLAAMEAHVARIGGLESRAMAQLAAENRLAEREIGIVEASAAAEAQIFMLGREFRVTETVQATPDPDLERIDVAVTDVARDETFAGFFGFVARTAAP